MGRFDELHAFLVDATGLLEREWHPLELSPWGLLNALWPMSDVFRPKMDRLNSVPYESRAEAGADEAILAFARRGAADWQDLSADVWRVLVERHTQMLMVCMANEAAGRKTMWLIPAQLPESHRTRAAVLEWWLRMELPFPVHQSGSLALPEGSVPGPMRRQ